MIIGRLTKLQLLHDNEEVNSQQYKILHLIITDIASCELKMIQNPNGYHLIRKGILNDILNELVEKWGIKWTC